MSRRPNKSLRHPQLNPPKLALQALRGFERDLGSRTAVIDAMKGCELSEEETYLMDLMADPREAGTPLARLCGQARVSIPRFLDIFRRGAGAQALAAAHGRIYEKLPEVAADVMARALPRHFACFKCPGPECDKCHGVGYLTEDPELETQKVALQIGGLLKSGGGTEVNVNQQNISAISMLRTTADFRSATDAVLYPTIPRTPSPDEPS